VLTLVKPRRAKRTEFERAKAKAEAVRETLAKLERARHNLEDELEEAILAGKNTEALDKQLCAVTESIAQAVKRTEVYERAAEAALPEHLRYEIEGLQEEIRQLEAEGAKVWAEFEPLRKEFYKAEALFQSGATQRGHRIQGLLGEISRLEVELRELLERKEPKGSGDCAV
jgi:chromosome segregation ATPase